MANADSGMYRELEKVVLPNLVFKQDNLGTSPETSSVYMPERESSVMDKSTVRDGAQLFGISL